MAIAVLDTLVCARQIADYATRLGIFLTATPRRPAARHIGSILADAVLQAGLNYRTVVKARVDRIEGSYPQAARLSGVRAIIENGMTSDFLLWRHPTKISRFILLAVFLGEQGIEDTNDLCRWLSRKGARDNLLALNGFGPKTYDYICCLVGIDCIPVDRHVKAFASEAGVPVTSYDELQVAVSYAADLLGVPRRDFDAWIWHQLSGGTREPLQPQML